MWINGIIDEDFANYKVPSMFISTIKCSWKCGKEVCQNRHLENAVKYQVDDRLLIARYTTNPLTRAIVFGGLEPLDQIDELVEFIRYFRMVSNDMVVIYSGYNFDEIYDEFSQLLQFDNILLKVGRYLPNRTAVYEPQLGVTLSSDNQYVVVI